MKNSLTALLSIICLVSPSLCFSQIAPPVVAQPAPTVVAERSVPIFKDGLAQIIPGFKKSSDWIKHDLWVETEFDSDQDGQKDRMHVSVCRQKQTDTEGLKVPVIYNTSPYFCGIGSTAPNFMWSPKHEIGAEPPKHQTPPAIPQQSKRPEIAKRYNTTWLPRGFATVYSSSPGTGLSDGCPTVGGDNEALAPKAVIQWLCGRAKGFTSATGNEPVTAYWCSGKVGMTGTSYEGTLPIAAATTGVEGLAAIIPDAANTSYYHYYRSNGLVRHPGGYMGEDIDVLYNFIHSGAAENCAGCNQRVRDNLMASNQDRITGDYNDFWAGRNYRIKLNNYKTPTLLSHGLSDWNVMPGHSIHIFEALKAKGVPCQMYLHQGGHGGLPPLKMMNRWFSHYLYGIDNGVENAPQLYVVREGENRNSPAEYKTYPNPDAQPVKLHLTTGGQQIGGLTTAATNSKAAETLTDNANISGKKLAQANPSPHRLLYATPILQSDVHLSGTPKVTIKMASSKPAANLSIWLVSLPWEKHQRGKRIKLTDNLITRGWADPQNNQSLTESQPLEPGKFYEVTFPLQPDDHVIKAGQQIGLMIFSSDRDFTLWPEPGTALTIDLDGTSLELPIVGGASGLNFQP